MNARHAETSAPIIDPIASRWSPRSFATEHSLPEGALRGVFEAARWAPSASNTQPWRFIIARRGGEAFAKVEATLIGFNQQWAGRAAALVVNVAETVGAEGKTQRWAEYDLGQAVATYSLQARAEGLYAHQMGGFDPEALRTAFGLTEHQVPVSVSAIGAIGEPEQLPDTLREREVAPRSRMDLDDLILLND